MKHATRKQMLAVVDKIKDKADIHEDDGLTDLCCPNCGCRDSLNVNVSTYADLMSDGCDVYGDTEWDGDSAIQCKSCGHGGVVKQFTFKGLDDHLAELAEK